MDFFVPRQVAKSNGIPNVTTVSKQNFIAADIIKQVECLFTDKNLANNDLLRKRMEDDSEGFVDIALLKKFNTLHSITDNEEYIAQAVKELSKTIEINADGKRVRRKIPYFTVADASRDDRVLYVEKLSAKESNTSKIKGDIKALFSVAGQVKDVYIPYDADGKVRFHGFAFVEFSTTDELAAAIRLFGSEVPRADAGDKPDAEFSENMRIMVKSQWLEKAKEYKEYQMKEIGSGCYKPLNQPSNGYTVLLAKKLQFGGGNARGSKRKWAGQNIDERAHATSKNVIENDTHDTSRPSIPLEKPKPTHIRFDDSD